MLAPPLATLANTAWHQVLHATAIPEWHNFPAIRGCVAQMGYFFTKILSHGFHFGQKILRSSWKRVPFHKYGKSCKISHFWGMKNIDRSPFVKMSEKKPVNQPFFEGEKSLDMGLGFRPLSAYPVKIFQVSPPPRPPVTGYKTDTSNMLTGHIQHIVDMCNMWLRGHRWFSFIQQQ